MLYQNIIPSEGDVKTAVRSSDRSRYRSSSFDSIRTPITVAYVRRRLRVSAAANAERESERATIEKEQGEMLGTSGGRRKHKGPDDTERRYFGRLAMDLFNANPAVSLFSYIGHGGIPNPRIESLIASFFMYIYCDLNFCA